jgi:glycine/sarcosine N-methyltransferase
MMDFYNQISRYYDDIFPVSETTVDFFTDVLKDIPGNRVLDVACGSGNHAANLAQRGFDVTAVDLDPSMVRLAQSKANTQTPSFVVLQGDMRNVDEEFAEPFDAVICMGNSLVHLSNEEEIESTVGGFSSLLVPGGVLILQTINYDRILEQNIRQLPTITNAEAKLIFIRKYDYNPSQGLVYFNTVLEVPDGTYENSVPLYPLRKEALSQILKINGFSNQRFYGSFRQDSWNPNSYATIAVTVK